jgi:copper chaperone
MTTHEITIQGMNCRHCVAAVEKELKKIPQLTLDDVQIGSAKVSYDETQVNEAALRKAIDEAGYTFVSIR